MQHFSVSRKNFLNHPLVLLNHSDNLSKTLQSPHLSAAHGQKIVQMTVCTLQSLRSDDNFLLFWTKVKKMAIDVEVNNPVLPRQRKRPRRYEDGSEEGAFPDKVEDLYRVVYFEAIDLIVNCIKDRFDQPGYQQYRKLEELLVNAANKEPYDEHLKQITNFYKEDFDTRILELQLDVMACNIPRDSPTDTHNLASILQYLRECSNAQKELMSEVCKVASLVKFSGVGTVAAVAALAVAALAATLFRPNINIHTCMTS